MEQEFVNGRRTRRYMKDGQTRALDTLSRVELLVAADLCLKKGLGHEGYRAKVSQIVKDAYAQNGNLYLTIQMRRAIMGFIRPVFDAQLSREVTNTCIQGNTQLLDTSNTNSKPRLGGKTNLLGLGDGLYEA